MNLDPEKEFAEALENKAHMGIAMLSLHQIYAHEVLQVMGSKTTPLTKKFAKLASEFMYATGNKGTIPINPGDYIGLNASRKNLVAVSECAKQPNEFLFDLGEFFYPENCAFSPTADETWKLYIEGTNLVYTRNRAVTDLITLCHICRRDEEFVEAFTNEVTLENLAKFATGEDKGVICTIPGQVRAIAANILDKSENAYLLALRDLMIEKLDEKYPPAKPTVHVSSTPQSRFAIPIGTANSGIVRHRSNGRPPPSSPPPPPKPPTYTGLISDINENFARGKASVFKTLDGHRDITLPKAGCWAYYWENEAAIRAGIAGAQLDIVSIIELLVIADLALPHLRAEKELFISNCLFGRDLMIAKKLGITPPEDVANYFKQRTQSGSGQAGGFTNPLGTEDIVRLAEATAMLITADNPRSFNEIQKLIGKAATYDLHPGERMGLVHEICFWSGIDPWSPVAFAIDKPINSYPSIGNVRVSNGADISRNN